MKQGDIHWVRDPGFGERPAVILTRSIGISFLHSLIVAPITSTLRDTPTHVPVGPEHGLRHPSVISLDNMKSLDHVDIGHQLGTLDNDTLNAVYEAIRAVFELPH